MKQSAPTSRSESTPGGAHQRTLRLRLAPFVALLVLAISGAAVVATGQRDAAATTPTYTLFGTASPRTGPDPERAQLEVGTVFASARSGTASAIRFYKHRADTGLHYGSLWDSGGRLLASVALPERNRIRLADRDIEQARADQAGRRLRRIPHRRWGSYAADPTYFAAGWKRTGPLVAKKGVYRYGAGFPTQSLANGDSHYFSDVTVLGRRRNAPADIHQHPDIVDAHHDASPGREPRPRVLRPLAERSPLRHEHVPIRGVDAGPDEAGWHDQGSLQRFGREHLRRDLELAD